MRPFKHASEQQPMKFYCGKVGGVSGEIGSTPPSRLLIMLHDGHPGIVRMKALARSYFWWPKMDENI
ncbi:hypothetical protein T08_4855 [Trichinella sp. T8]|nr:hypothetical protein T08_4855 [Trichinella sp. T8]